MAYAPARSADQKPVPQAAASCRTVRALGSGCGQGQALGVRQVVLRLGVVLEPRRRIAATAAMIRLGVGGRMGSGQQVMSWIHRDDVLALIHAAARPADARHLQRHRPRDPLHRPPLWPPRAMLRRPVWLPVPATTPLRWAMGEMAQLFVDGQNVVPARLQQQGLPSSTPTLEQALRDLV